MIDRDDHLNTLTQELKPNIYKVNISTLGLLIPHTIKIIFEKSTCMMKLVALNIFDKFRPGF